MMETDEQLRAVFERTHKIAVVGASMNPARPSHYVSQFLASKGFTIIPVNPGHAGERLFGETVRASLADCPDDVDMVDIFRRSEHVPPVVDEALQHLPNLSTIWMQIGVRHAEAAERARGRGVDVVQDRCPKIEYPRLFG